ncbi:Thermonuclease precursor [Aquimixticola soesokkakensis]|uniref:Thermonuclease n=2 Tax=Aquimixticola soesokkakensis TaxID=1519096 RepID=A0A1Y5SAD6_9RHOB|nr:Thermonuclease precursor [Aquimixticola soesokkakensis]
MRKLLTLFLFASMPAHADTVPDCGLYTYRVEVQRVIDGDTIVANIDLGFDTWLHNEHLRLYGINTPERGQPGYQEAIDVLTSRIQGQPVYICTHKMKRSDAEATGSFGRYLATVYVNGEDINQWLVGQGLAVVFRE